MNIKLSIFTGFVLISLLALPVLGEMGMGSIRGKSGDMMVKGQEMRKQGGMTGMGFMHSNGQSYGGFVTFAFDNKTGTINDYGITGITIFDSIKVSLTLGMENQEPKV